MKLDEATLSVLKNFQTINNSILIKPGNTLLTVSSVGTMLGKAKIPNEFPSLFGIYDLKKFLAVAAMMKDAELEFHDEENHLIFREGNKKVKFPFCHPETIVVPKNDPKPFGSNDILLEFVLKPDMISQATAAMGIFQHEGINIKGEDGKLILLTLADTNVDSFSIEIGETDLEFNIHFEKEKISPIFLKEYKATLSKKKAMHLESDNISYWIAANANKSLIHS